MPNSPNPSPGDPYEALGHGILIDMRAFDIEAIDREIAKKETLMVAYGGVTKNRMSANMRASMAILEDGDRKPKSDIRFRSFCERWVAARCHLFRQEFIQADTWECVQQAKTAYKMIEMVGRSPDIE